MRSCCPPGFGCNAPARDEPCALSLFRAASEEQGYAALALVRWTDFQDACEHYRSERERRFRRRAFTRARDRALIALAMRPSAAVAAGSAPKPEGKRSRCGGPRRGGRVANAPVPPG